MATATFPARCVLCPEYVHERQAYSRLLNPRAMCFTRLSTARSWSYRPWEPTKVGHLPISLAQLLDAHVRQRATSQVERFLLSCSSGSMSPRASSGGRTWHSWRRRGGRSENEFPREKPGTWCPNLAVEVVSKSNTGEEILAKLRTIIFETGTRVGLGRLPLRAARVRVYVANCCPHPGRASGS